MTNETESDEIAEIAESTPEKKPKLPLVIILSILTGVLAVVMAAGSIFHFQSRKALHAELLSTKDELKRKSAQLAEQQEQIAGLSMQMHALKEFSLARTSPDAAATSGEASAAGPGSKSPAPVEPAVSAASGAPSATAAKNNPPAHTDPAPAKPAPISVPVAKKAAAPLPGCQLTGKSAEEQAATLKRCMQSLDSRR